VNAEVMRSPGDAVSPPRGFRVRLAPGGGWVRGLQEQGFPSFSGLGCTKHDLLFSEGQRGSGYSFLLCTSDVSAQSLGVH
jgi:hypothetical protein